MHVRVMVTLDFYNIDHVQVGHARVEIFGRQPKQQQSKHLLHMHYYQAIILHADVFQK